MEESPARMEAVYVEGSFDGMRIDAFLAAVAAFPTRSAAARRVDAGEVRVNGTVVRKSFTVRTSDVVEYVVAMDARVLELMPADIPLDIRYEDDDVIVLSKQAGLVTHPADGHPEQDTLVNALIAHCGREKLCNVQGEQDRLGIVHRLDRDTSGLMLAAKTDAAGLRLMEDIAARDVDRHYLALVHGWIPLDTGLIDAPIGRSAKDRLRMCVSDRESARPASTSFRVVRRFEPSRRDDGYTLIDCKLFTGRTHQIRVHAEYIKHPCVGDPTYGWPKHDNLGLERQFLHSYRLAFTHPSTGARLSFEDGLPADLQAVVDELDARA